MVHLRRRLLFGLAATVAFGRPGTGDEKVWKEYVEWYRRQPAKVSDIRRAYVDHLRRAGVSEAELRKRSEIIDRLTAECRDELRPIFFDRTYSSSEPRFNTAPNALLIEAVHDLKPGRALDIHMGQGRNAVYLASTGWDVTGFDFSAAGVDAARSAAKKAGVAITALVRRHEEFDFGRARWDLVVMSYTWIPLRSRHMDRIFDSLKPGGVIVFEHLMDESGSERAAPWLPRPNELPRIFDRLRILRYEDVRAGSDWSWRPERIARLVAKKQR